MSTLDEITKEKQRVGEALVRVDAQREKLTGQLADPRRSGACLSKRQDAAGNRRCMQGSSPEPCRRRHFPAQAGWPHRTARREALRHTVDGDGATRRNL